MGYALTPCWILLLIVALAESGCQTFDDSSPEMINTWSRISPPRQNDVKTGIAQPKGAPLLSGVERGKTMLLEGTGRFIGEPVVGAIKPYSERAEDGVTLNLVNVPAPQAAKTVLGDILAAQYTISCGSRGNACERRDRMGVPKLSAD